LWIGIKNRRRILLLFKLRPATGKGAGIVPGMAFTLLRRFFGILAFLHDLKLNAALFAIVNFTPFHLMAIRHSTYLHVLMKGSRRNGQGLTPTIHIQRARAAFFTYPRGSRFLILIFLIEICQKFWLHRGEIEFLSRLHDQLGNGCSVIILYFRWNPLNRLPYFFTLWLNYCHSRTPFWKAIVHRYKTVWLILHYSLNIIYLVFKILSTRHINRFTHLPGNMKGRLE
jgi:hypothetical protein